MMPPAIAVGTPATPTMAAVRTSTFAVVAVADRAHDRGRDDDRGRRALGDDGDHPEPDHHRRHRDDPAADPEQSGERAGDQSDRYEEDRVADGEVRPADRFGVEQQSGGGEHDRHDEDDGQRALRDHVQQRVPRIAPAIDPMERNNATGQSTWPWAR